MNFETVFGVLGALGGGAVIIGGFAHWLGNLWAKRLIQQHKAKLDFEIESHKVILKKSEFIFEKEYEAVSKFMNFFKRIQPKFYKADIDTDEAYDQIAGKFGQIENEIHLYLLQHSAVLPERIRRLLYEAESQAASNKHMISGPKISKKANKKAEELYDKLKDIEKILQDELITQYTVKPN